jgi:hypothetical protein
VSRFTHFITVRKDFLQRDVSDAGDARAAFFRIVMDVAPRARNGDDVIIIFDDPIHSKFSEGSMKRRTGADGVQGDRR